MACLGSLLIHGKNLFIRRNHVLTTIMNRTILYHCADYALHMSAQFKELVHSLYHAHTRLHPFSNLQVPYKFSIFLVINIY